MYRLILLAAALLLTGCSGLLHSPQPPAHLYQLQLNTPLARASTGDENRTGVVVVAPPEVAAGYDTAAMAYRRTPWEIHYYAQSSWVDEPASMLRLALTSALDQAGPFQSAVQTPSGVSANYSLRTELLRLEQDFGNAPPSRERLVVRARLVDLQRGTVLASRLFDLSTTAPSEDAHGGAVAANKALEQLAREVIEFCRHALGNRSEQRPYSGGR